MSAVRRGRRLGRWIALGVGAALGCDSPSGPGAPGRVIWGVAGEGWGVQPAVDSSTVYFADARHTVLAVDKRTGSVRWRQRTPVTTPYTRGNNLVLAGDVVVFPDGDLHAFDRRTGARRWEFTPPNLDQPGYGRLAVKGSVIYAGTPEGRVYAVEAVTGQALWTADLSGGDSTIATFDPVIDGDRLYVGIKRYSVPARGALAALDLATGRELWRRDFEPLTPDRYSGCLGNAVVSGGMVYATTEDGHIHALDRDVGATQWVVPPLDTFPSGQRVWYDWRGLGIAGGVLVASSLTGFVVGIDARDGRERWRTSHTTISAWKPIATSDGVAYVEHGGFLVVYDIRTGAVRWRIATGVGVGPPNGMFAPPALEPGRLYGAGTDGFFALTR